MFCSYSSTQQRITRPYGRYAPDSFGTIEGEITDIFWRNPHVRLLIGRTGDDGVRLDWLAQIADTVNFTEPVVMEGAWTWVPGHEIEPFNCELPEFAN